MQMQTKQVHVLTLSTRHSETFANHILQMAYKYLWWYQPQILRNGSVHFNGTNRTGKLNLNCSMQIFCSDNPFWICTSMKKRFNLSNHLNMLRFYFSFAHGSGCICVRIWLLGAIIAISFITSQFRVYCVLFFFVYYA